MFRVVENAELESISELGGYTLKEGLAESKYFFKSVDNAIDYAKDIYSTTKNSQTLTKVSLKSNLLKKADVQIGEDVFRRTFYTIGKGTLGKFPQNFPQNPSIIKTSKELMSNF